MYTGSSSAISLFFLSFSKLFTRQTFTVFSHLATGALLNRGRQTITGMLRHLPMLEKRDYSRYNRFFSKPAWSLLAAARILFDLVNSAVPPEQPLRLVVDDTTTRRKGPYVYGSGSHRDAVRSSRKQTILCNGHKWMVVALLAKLPGIKRSWALPLLTYLVLPAKHPKHRKPSELLHHALRLLQRWQPNRRLLVVGDTHYGGHPLAKQLHERGIVLVSRLHPGAMLYAPPPPRQGRGRPRIKGERLPSPCQRTQNPEASWQACTMRWYGGKTRTIDLLSDTGYWYRSGKGVVRVRWVAVRCPNARLEYFYSNDPALTPTEIVQHYIDRWSIEVTFEESRRHLRLEQTEVWSKNAVLRMVPCLFGLFSVSAVWFKHKLEHDEITIRQDPWYPKDEPTYADLIVSLRQELIHETYFMQTQYRPGVVKNQTEQLEALILLATHTT